MDPSTLHFVILLRLDVVSDAILHPKQGHPGTEQASKDLSVIDAERFIGRAAQTTNSTTGNLPPIA